MHVLTGRYVTSDSDLTDDCYRPLLFGDCFVLPLSLVGGSGGDDGGGCGGSSEATLLLLSSGQTMTKVQN